MPKFERATTISARPERVFDYVSDITRHPEWASNKLQIESSPPGGVSLGARFVTVGRQIGVYGRDEVTVTECAPPERFGFEATSPDGRFLHLFRLEPANGGTRVTKSMDFVEMSWATRLSMPLIAVWAWWVLARDLKQIKMRLE